jgi:monothiol glutaredoxin
MTMDLTYEDVYKETLRNIEDDVKNTPVLLYMKGTKSLPLCGFSGRVVEILHELDVDFETINVLDDELLKTAIKEFSGWPTLPQLYIKGTFIGGCDIVTQLYETGELKKILDE